jgi:cytochrome c oxidase subunit 1
VDAVAGWEPRHLAWIVQEGVKMSGMPAWPADREDEVWPVDAFLDAARGKEGADYARLTVLPEAGYCAGCHGEDGVGELGPHVPRLDIQNAAYLLSALESYRDGPRQSGIMRHAATVVPPEALEQAIEHYAALTPVAQGVPTDEALARQGAALAAAETGDDDVPACRACHGPDPAEWAEGTPSLSGQHQGYLETQLRLWRGGERGGGPRANLMHVVALDLTDADIAALAAYYAGLPPSK